MYATIPNTVMKSDDAHPMLHRRLIKSKLQTSGKVLEITPSIVWILHPISFGNYTLYRLDFTHIIMTLAELTDIRLHAHD